MQCGCGVIAFEENPVSFVLAFKRVKSLASIIYDCTELRNRETVTPAVCGIRVHISIFDNDDDPAEDLILKECTNCSNLNQTKAGSRRSSSSCLFSS